MKKYDLLKNEKDIIRVLEIKQDRILIIDCIKKTMPIWVESSDLNSFSCCPVEELMQVTGFDVSMNILDADQKKIMYDRYTLIALFFRLYLMIESVLKSFALWLMNMVYPSRQSEIICAYIWPIWILRFLLQGNIRMIMLNLQKMKKICAGR